MSEKGRFPKGYLKMKCNAEWLQWDWDLSSKKIFFPLSRDVSEMSVPSRMEYGNVPFLLNFLTSRNKPILPVTILLFLKYQQVTFSPLMYCIRKTLHGFLPLIYQKGSWDRNNIHIPDGTGIAGKINVQPVQVYAQSIPWKREVPLEQIIHISE